VSVVTGQLRENATPLDLLRSAFPGGSITGAPKVRAMEIIAELEPTARGAYCGSLGYLGFDGTTDLSILIRTITAGRGWWQLPVGGGIVAQSDPRREYEETWHKATGLIRHPESILTDRGYDLLAGFLRIAGLPTARSVPTMESERPSPPTLRPLPSRPVTF
jgi:anthranilate/para-aminobenzoate synthase component I